MKTSLALATMVASSAVLFITLHAWTPSADLRPQEALGRAVAQEAVKLANGGRIVLIALDTAAVPNECMAALARAFHAEIKSAHATVSHTNLVKLNPLALLRVPPGQFADLLHKFTDKDLIVSLLGPPLLSGDQRARLPAKTARVLAVCSGETPKQVPMKSLFQAGLIEEAIICRPGARASTQGGGGADLFNQLFMTITTANISELPAPSSSAGAGL